MKTHLILFTIGPIQSFIAQARKTRDLFSGSKLLSDIINKTIKPLSESGEIIFPDSSITSMPNRFILEMETDSPEKFCRGLEQEIREIFQKKLQRAIKNTGAKNWDTPSYKNQSQNFLEIYWGALPFKIGDYAQTYTELERLVGSAKNLKAFAQVSELGIKCSICGERNVIFCRKSKNKKFHRHYQKDLCPISSSTITLDDTEGLCAICFTKRFYSNKPFSSTAKIALGDTLKRLKNNPKSLAILKEFRELFTTDFDEQFYFEENLRESYFEKYELDIGLLSQAQGLQKKIKKKAKDQKIAWSPYYALVMLDGDSMGKWLSGEFLQDKSKLKDFHKQISSQLGDYAREVEEQIMVGSRGSLVYAGGDDVMAFVNLNHLFEILGKLRHTFPKIEILAQTKGEHHSSASAGVVIAHYKTPLSEVLKATRSAEHQAKKIKGKDGFALCCLKHSGEKIISLQNWTEPSTIENIQKIIRWLSEERVSNKFISSLRREFMPLLHKEKKKEKETKEKKKERKEIEEKEGEEREIFLETELQRLILRAKSSTQTSKEEAKEFSKKVFSLFAPKMKLSEGDFDPLENFLSLLEICEFLSRYTHGK